MHIFARFIVTLLCFFCGFLVLLGSYTLWARGEMHGYSKLSYLGAIIFFGILPIEIGSFLVSPAFAKFVLAMFCIGGGSIMLLGCSILWFRGDFQFHNLSYVCKFIFGGILPLIIGSFLIYPNKASTQGS